MRRTLPHALLCFCALVVGAVPVAAADYRETEDLALAAEVAEGYADRFGAESTLAVFDIDNTLLAMDRDLGSDQWFVWQEYLREQEPNSPDLVADDLPGLLEVQGLLFTLGRMSPPQVDAPDVVAGIQQLGAPTLVLTSRGPQYRDATFRELKRAGYDFPGHAPDMPSAPSGVFLPFDLDRPEASGLTAEEAELFGLKEPRAALLEGGIYMVSGQHKGAMLLTALEHLPEQPKAVVYVDDHGRHVHRVYDALVRRGIEVTAIHYRKEDERVDRFRYGDKGEVAEQWLRITSVLREVFGPESVPAERPAKTAAEVSPARSASH